MIEIETTRPICLELYKDNKDLGRFMLRYSGSTIGAGVVTEVSLGFYVMRETDETASIHTQLAHNLLILYMQILCL